MSTSDVQPARATPLSEIVAGGEQKADTNPVVPIHPNAMVAGRESLGGADEALSPAQLDVATEAASGKGFRGRLRDEQNRSEPEDE